MYKPFKPHPALLPHRVPAVRKWDDASFRLPGAIAAERVGVSIILGGKPGTTLPENAPNNGSAWTISPSN
jgi:hypothetical protein